MIVHPKHQMNILQNSLNYYKLNEIKFLRQRGTGFMKLFTIKHLQAMATHLPTTEESFKRMI